MTSIRETFLPDEGCFMVRCDLCLTGPTKIETLQGPVEIWNIKKGDKVLTFRDCRVAWGEVTKVKTTGVHPIWLVTLDDGGKIEGTAQHRFLVVRNWGRKGKKEPVIEEVCLKDLKEGDRLVPLRKTIQLGYEVLYSRSSFEYTKTHHLVTDAYLGPCPEGYERHHIDGDKLNNDQKNLRFEAKRKHNSLHAKESFSRVDEKKRVKALREAIKHRDLSGAKNGMFGVRRLGSDNPNYGNRKGVYKTCPVCGEEFYVKLSLKDRKYCSKACYVNDQRGLNHKVVKVENLKIQAVMYSITVEPDHNYALSAGVFVSNSQIEDRICKMYCSSKRMVELANRRPEEYDAHTDNATMIFGKLGCEITKDERYLGKRTTHGAQRGLRGHRLSENISKDTKGTLFVHPKKCDKMLDAYLEKMFEIPEIYFPFVRQTIRDVGILTTSWGRRIDLRDRFINDDLYREGYSFFMQAEAADWTNQYGFIPGTVWMTCRYGRPLNAQAHDEVIASIPFQDLWDYSTFIIGAFEQSREIPAGSGNWLTVPAELSVGRSWGDKEAVEFKSLPRKRDDFYDLLWKGGVKDE